MLDEEALGQVAQGVWGTLAGLPAPALLFSGGEFAVVALNAAAQALFQGASPARATRVLMRSIPDPMLERIGLAARGLNAHVHEHQAQLILHDSAPSVRITVLPIPAGDGAPMAVMYFSVERAVRPTSFMPITHAVLSWLPMPAWLIDHDLHLSFQNAQCTDLPLKLEDDGGEPSLKRLFDAAQSTDACMSAMIATAAEAHANKSISSRVAVCEDGETWRIVHMPVTGADNKPYLLGVAIVQSRDLLGDVSPVDDREDAQRRLKLQIRARENERYKLAREIHDSLGQELTVLRLSAGHLLDVISTDFPLTEQHQQFIDQFNAQMQTTISTSRHIAFQMRTDLVETKGLVAATEALVAQIRHRLGCVGQLEVGPGWVDPEPRLAANIYRSAQELLNNMAKHSRAKHFIVRMSQSREFYQVQVADDGVGIPLEKRQGSLGLHTMRERVELHHGSMHIETRPEVDGTNITLKFRRESAGEDAPDTNY